MNDSKRSMWTGADDPQVVFVGVGGWPIPHRSKTERSEFPPIGLRSSATALPPARRPKRRLIHRRCRRLRSDRRPWKPSVRRINPCCRCPRSVCRSSFCEPTKWCPRRSTPPEDCPTTFRPALAFGILPPDNPRRLPDPTPPATRRPVEISPARHDHLAASRSDADGDANAAWR